MVLKPSSKHTEGTLAATSEGDNAQSGHLEAQRGIRDVITLLQLSDQGSGHLLNGFEFYVA